MAHNFGQENRLQTIFFLSSSWKTRLLENVVLSFLFIMANDKISPELKQRIFQLLQLKYSHSMVLKELKKDNVTVSKATISKIKNLKVFHSRVSQKIENGGRKRGPKFKLRPYQLK